VCVYLLNEFHKICLYLLFDCLVLSILQLYAVTPHIILVWYELTSKLQRICENIFDRSFSKTLIFWKTFFLYKFLLSCLLTTSS